MINFSVSQEEEVIKVRLGQFATMSIEDYNLLVNRPTVDGKIIEGPMTSSDFGVVTDYEDLSNIPTIDGVELKGDMSSSDLSLVKSYNDLEDKPTVDGKTIEGAMTSSDLGVIKDYEGLDNLPSINGVEIKGNLSKSDVGIVDSYTDLHNKPTVDGKAIEGSMTASDFGVVTDYEDLNNLPTLNGEELKGDIVIGDLGFVLTNTMAGWSAQRDLVSKKDVFYVYSDYQAINNGSGSVVVFPGLKVGDGHTKLNQLPFMNSPDPRLLNHIANNIIHVTSEERTKWNKAVSDLIVVQSQLQGGMHDIGVTTTELTDGSSTNTILIDGKYVTPTAGDFVKYGAKEFMYAKGGYWVELGDESFISSLLDSNGKINESYLPAKAYDSTSGTLSL